jgi:hypothetical protein
MEEVASSPLQFRRKQGNVLKRVLKRIFSGKALRHSRKKPIRPDFYISATPALLRKKKESLLLSPQPFSPGEIAIVVVDDNFDSENIPSNANIPKIPKIDIPDIKRAVSHKVCS